MRIKAAAPVIPRSGGAPSPDEIAEVAAEIRSGWSTDHRWRSRASVLAIKTDELDGFVWPASGETDQADETGDDWEEGDR